MTDYQQGVRDVSRVVLDMARTRGEDAEPCIAYVGAHHYARMVQVTGLLDAARSWGITALDVDHRMVIADLRRYRDITVLAKANMLPSLARELNGVNWQAILYGDYYDATPTEHAVPIHDNSYIQRVLDDHRDRIVCVLSELSAAGNAQYYSGYWRNHGLPVMSFPWGVNADKHLPRPDFDFDDPAVFLGAYWEKGKRIDDWFGPVAEQHRICIIGDGWEQAVPVIRDRCLPYDYSGSTRVEDFDATAPWVYSHAAVSLNIHHEFEAREGYTCNERTFNAVACGGFVINDDNRRVRDFFGATEVVCARDPEDYAALVDQFVSDPAARNPYMRLARRTVFAHHTYHHRLADLLHMAWHGQPLSDVCEVSA